MNIDKNIRTSAATAVIIAASTSLVGNITVANADSVNKTGVVNTSTLNVRKGPGTNNAILTKIYKNDKVTITESSKGWYKVKLSNGKTGWVSDDYIKVTSSNNSTSNNSSSSKKTGTVTTSTLNVRKGAGTSHAKVGTLKKGNKVTIQETKNGWHKVKLSNGTVGWASGDYIKVSTSSNTSNNTSSSNQSNVSNKIGTVNTSSLNVRKGAGTNYSTVGSLKSGQKVGILSTSNGWYNVVLPSGSKGWVSSKYIKVSNGDPYSVVQKSNAATKAVALAKKQLGKPYGWGAEGPNSFDCSGLTYYVYKQNGITLPRASKSQASAGKSVSKSNLKAGDLVFFNTNGKGISHVGIYIGDGKMIHSTKPGDVVKTTSINSSYYKNKFVTARRIVN
ncbi:peptidoglycan endopeptidase [Romboutsia ilealis]|uniref:SH3 domain-containing protein n=1 Tax=Romboutsia faecis TaxID=2764597 RepID=A0ABR7JLR3_9FIRM|nr:C40 family peptidase [Romboutsia faecis]MBC5995869.1 SH3 domain-containing protein [Romboutsia faecis]MRN23068.1 peptidoglycan endopeptidase [Romboutsia ilealis]